MLKNRKRVTVFNFPFGAQAHDAVLRDMSRCDRYYNEADIVIPSNTLWSDYQFDVIKKSNYGKVIKFIIEPYILKNDFSICKKIQYHGFDYIKTHTGFGPRGVNVDDIKKIKDIVGNEIKIKASGGIKHLDDLMKLKEAGAERFGIGIESAINIIKELG